MYGEGRLEEVLKLIRAGMSAPSIANEIGCTHYYVKRLIASFIDEGYIKRQPLYRLSAKGRKYLRGKNE